MTEMRVYTASVECLKDPELYQKALALLPAQRRESANRMKPLSGKCLSAGAGLLLMTALTDYLEPVNPASQKTERGNPISGKSALGDLDQEKLNQAGGKTGSRDIRRFTSLRFEQGEYGKPYLPDFPEVHFNLSHSGSRVMCAVSPKPAGCDVEQIEPERFRQVIRCLAESEQRQVKDSPENFYRIWTLKESFLKLTGKGFQIPFKSFEISLDPLSVKQEYISQQVRLKEYNRFRDAEQYCCSCAVAGIDPPDEMIEIDLGAVLEDTRL